ncbi:uncharacterized protein DS421_3g82430 [Arachis hypogaea]|nr:uncharacterized protein DS421_3g82430 [Arachis hypogaea]
MPRFSRCLQASSLVTASSFIHIVNHRPITHYRRLIIAVRRLLLLAHSSSLQLIGKIVNHTFHNSNNS